MSVDETLVAGVDVGTSNVKAGVYRLDGTAVAQHRTATPSGAAELRDTAVRLLARCVAEAPRQPVAVGVASMAETGVGLDADGDPVGPLLGWQDRRAARQAEQLAAAVGTAPFHRTTGLLPTAKLPVARWSWLREHQPAVLDRMRHWASAADLVSAALTGTVGTDATLAARTGAYDIVAGEYVPELLDRSGLKVDQMPPVMPVARINPAGAARSGLAAGTPVVVAGHDHLVAGFAAGVREPGHTADSMGTAEAIVTPVAAPPPMDPLRAAGIAVAPFPGGTSYCLISGSANCGALASWWSDRYDAFGEPGGRPTGIVVQPYLSGRTTPMPDPHRRLSVHGVGPGHTPTDLARAVLEGICFQARWMLETHATITGAMPDSVTVLGGPTASPAWMWIKTQVSPVPVAVADEVQCAAIGAAQLAARALDLPHPPLATRPQTRVPQTAAAFAAIYRSEFLPLAVLPSAHSDTPKGAS